jgi:hypothetical protein
LLAQVRWFSPASSTTKTGRHDIAEILLKVALKHKKSINQFIYNAKIIPNRMLGDQLPADLYNQIKI